MDIREIIKGRAAGLGEKVYIAPNIPASKLQNTVSGITGNNCNKDSVVAVLDTTIFGICDDGIAFTEEAMYFKAFMAKPVCVRYEDISSAVVKGIVLKELVVMGHDGNITQKIEAEKFNPGVTADILNTIVQARKEQKCREAENNEDIPELGEADFEKASARQRAQRAFLQAQSQNRQRRC